MFTSRALQKPLFEMPVRSLADVHTSKRRERERTGVYGWHPCYAGYAVRQDLQPKPWRSERLHRVFDEGPL